MKLNFSFFPFLNGLAALADLEPLIYNVVTTILQYVGFRGRRHVAPHILNTSTGYR
jgi:hypothetical protein